MTTDRTVALVRQAIFHVLDEGRKGGAVPGVSLGWRFNDLNDDIANADRMDFADRVVEWLVQQEPRPCRQLDASLVEFSEMFKREAI